MKTVTFTGAGPTPGTYGDATNSARLVVNNQGSITSASNVTFANPAETNTCIVTRTTAGAVTPGTTLTFPNVVYDPLGMYNNGNGRVTVPLTGVYQIACGVDTSTGNFEAQVSRNAGAQIVLFCRRYNLLSNGNASTSLFLNAGDTLEVVITLGATLSSTANRTYFTVSRAQ